jgi:hypothetical protein
MSDKRKTAVETIIAEFEKLGIYSPTIKSVCAPALSLEREQMRLIYEGILQNFGTNIKKSDLPTFNEYYEQTYGE